MRMRGFDNIPALLEGWDLFECDEPHRLEIQRLDDPASCPGLGFDDPKFADDGEALAFVMACARAGSAYHAEAIRRQGAIR